jgi:hypothetical protein
MRSFQVLMNCYPHAAAVVVRAVVKEGRAFGTRPEGERLTRELGASPWVEQGRILWEACGLDAPLSEWQEEQPAGSMLPSTWIRLLARSLAAGNLEEVLSKLMINRSAVPNEQRPQPDSRV